MSNETTNPAPRQAAVMRSLLLKYQEEWKKAKANSKRTTTGGYEKVDLKEWGKIEAFTMIINDLATFQQSDVSCLFPSDKEVALELISRYSGKTSRDSKIAKEGFSYGVIWLMNEIKKRGNFR